MTEKQYHPYAHAFTLACQFKGLIEGACTRVDVSGSIRRKRSECGDVEIVCIPSAGVDMFGDTTYENTRLETRIDELFESGTVSNRTKNGSKYKQFGYQDMVVDLFIVTPPAQFGVIMAIRTGSAGFSKLLVTTRNKGGWLPSNAQIKGGALFIEGDMVETPEEEDFFRAIGKMWIDPTMRM